MRPESAQNLLPIPVYVQPDWRKTSVLCIRGSTCFGIMLVVVACALASNIINFSMKSWANIGGDALNRTYSLFTCEDGPANIVGTSWDCLSTQTCPNPEEYGLCQTAKHAYIAGSSFLGLELFAITFALLLIERILYMCFTQPYGWCGIVYCLASWVFIIHLTAIAFWFGISEAEFDVSCNEPPADSQSVWKLCADTGPITATIGIGIGAIVGLSVCFLQFHRPAEVDKTSQPIGKGVVLKLPARVLAFLVFVLLWIHLGLMILCLSLKKWVRTGQMDGSLYEVSSWQGITDYGYDCIYIPECLNPAERGICNTFTSLSQAGMAYSWCIVIAMILWLFLMQSTIHYVFGFEFGFPAVNYAYGVLCGMVQTAGVLIWFAVSGTSITGNCEVPPPVEGDLRLDVCMSTGSIMAIVTMVFYWCVLGLWAYVYSKRR